MNTLFFVSPCFIVIFTELTFNFASEVDRPVGIGVGVVVGVDVGVVI